MNKKLLFVLMFLISPLVAIFGAVGEEKVWERGYTFNSFLKEYNIPFSVFEKMSAEDRELTSEIIAGSKYYTLTDKIETQEGGREFLVQALIPISDDMQIHISKNNNSYNIDFIPILYFEGEQSIAMAIQKSPYQDIMELTNDSALANEFINAYKNSLDFKRGIQKNNKMALVYHRKYRLGQPFGNLELKASMIESNKKQHYLFLYSGNNKYYNEAGKEIAGFMLQTPIAGYKRISSKFSRGRFHPVLKIRRPHYGVDYAAKVGTPVKSAGDGVIVKAGYDGGYGNVVEISHSGGLRTVYAHLHSFAKNMREGQKVKKGQVIGKVGNTGLSTGPHLHFGLYKNNRPVDPLASVQTTRSELKGKQKIEFLEVAKIHKATINQTIARNFSTDKDSNLVADAGEIKDKNSKDAKKQ